MRTKMFAAGLLLAANTSFAQTLDTSPTHYDDRVTLNNGCVYARNTLVEGNEWSLIYTQAGTTIQCPLTIYGQMAADPAPRVDPAQVAAAQIQDDMVSTVARADINPRPRLSFVPAYMVGVFR